MKGCVSLLDASVEERSPRGAGGRPTRHRQVALAPGIFPSLSGADGARHCSRWRCRLAPSSRRLDRAHTSWPTGSLRLGSRSCEPRRPQRPWCSCSIPAVERRTYHRARRGHADAPSRLAESGATL
jgi:hypothetical protein